MTQTEKDEKYMRMALVEAREAMERDEVPIGAVVVSPRGTVVGRGHNLTEALVDVSAHAEMQAITAAAQTLGGKYLQDCTLYVTVEPCLMAPGLSAGHRSAVLSMELPTTSVATTHSHRNRPFIPEPRLSEECWVKNVPN